MLALLGLLEGRGTPEALFMRGVAAARSASIFARVQVSVQVFWCQFWPEFLEAITAGPAQYLGVCFWGITNLLSAGKMRYDKLTDCIDAEKCGFLRIYPSKTHIFFSDVMHFPPRFSGNQRMNFEWFWILNDFVLGMNKIRSIFSNEIRAAFRVKPTKLRDWYRFRSFPHCSPFTEWKIIHMASRGKCNASLNQVVAGLGFPTHFLKNLAWWLKASISFMQFVFVRKLLFLVQTYFWTPCS